MVAAGSCWFSVCVLLSTIIAAQQPGTEPKAGIRKHTPRVYALVGANIVPAPDKEPIKGTLIVRDGTIEEFGPRVDVPDDARVLNVDGKWIYPGLIDAYSLADIPKPNTEAGYWNPYVTPERSAAVGYKADEQLNERYRQQGVVCRLLVPNDGIIKGTSALVTTADVSGRDAILRDNVSLHIHMKPVSRSRDQYPNSPMGAVALARQAFYDAKWYGVAWQVYRTRPGVPRPEFNASLEALQPYVAGDGLVVIECDYDLDVFRAISFLQEFGLRGLIRASGREYRRLDSICAAAIPMIVPLDFPEAPNVKTPDAVRRTSLRALLGWYFAPRNPAMLAEQGATFALCSAGLSSVEKFLPQVRKAVKHGLPEQVGLAALTVVPARLFGVADKLGTIERGKIASFVITSGPLFDASTKVIETWIDGQRYPVKPTPTADPRGKWLVTYHGPGKGKFVLELAGEPTKLTGKITLTDPGSAKATKQEPKAKQTKKKQRTGGAKPKGKQSQKHGEPTSQERTEVKLEALEFAGPLLNFSFDGQPLGIDGKVLFSATIISSEGDILWDATLYLPDGSVTPAQVRKVSKSPENTENSTSANEEGSKAEEKSTEQTSQKEPSDTSDLELTVNYPLGEFGRPTLPDQPRYVLFKNATIWTCEKEGVLRNASLLIGAGKILALGKIDEVPENCQVIDATGLHITPGIIDCHSHTATDGGVNESTQAITAEVRIGDFINCDDINIYYQLAGGVTTIHILHGSANPIGGQCQVIKLRWGALPDEMKMAEAPPTIKFALGENVKQSNWGDEYTTRYPQTRMGVEQIIRDAFAEALSYKQRWQQWHKTHKGLPPRRDLELDALVEVLEGKRFVHCHAYRQDEVLAFLRIVEDYGLKGVVLQHILEGYKVADEMARLGVMGSCFTDWWAYKFEVYDAIPWNGFLMHKAGVIVSFNSDSNELARHLNLEAAKIMRYGGLPAEEALKFVTIYPAIQLQIDKHVGSIKPGKHADLAVWSGPPLSNFTRCVQTWIDGRKFFDIKEDEKLRSEAQRIKAKLVQAILSAK